MFKLAPKERKILKDIAKLYGCRVVFGNQGSSWDHNKTIFVSEEKGLNYTLSNFFHELGHYVNYHTGKYMMYHDLKQWPRLMKMKSLRMVVRYCLDAELFTERQGRALMKFWFPCKKYITTYKNDKESFEFLRGYYLTSYYGE